MRVPTEFGSPATLLRCASKARPHARLQAGRFVYVATDVRDFIHLIDADSVWDDSPVAQ